ncbi:EAL and modified HD-GYP domain-containing signal transduction protein [Krasilnikovia cinnamomea]|uniref:EAL and modified HD-GYP domain-containing signal transduction protein n=1 Tax=Krasilnikovia cinnamomea TaxID=349313 RepID=A0A4Q7ZN54_9ACTN|nr:EAL and modified HD-GYP domain-containing signal transduction protein [Krasilnikovia cinnamomea]
MGGPVNPSVARALSGTQPVHVGRQPIFDRLGGVVAYELLFRGSVDAVAAGHRDTYATSKVIVNAFTEFGIREVVGDRLCFINVTQEFLTGELTLPFGPEQVVLEVLETVEVDDAVIAGITELVAAGYRIALDDFVWGSGHERLLDLASYVKLDLLDGDLSRLEEIVAACRRRPRLQIVAERLETAEQVELADRFGLELRQGYALSRPQVLTARSLSPSRIRRLELLSALSAADADLERVHSIIATDPALSLRVLRASNSAAAASATRISSVRQAVVMIGLSHIRQWAMLMVIDDVAEATEDQLISALTRARLCENVAGDASVAPEAAFMAGLIVGVAELLNVTPAVMARQLPLAAEVTEALVNGAGRLGGVLRTVQAYEHGDVVEPTEVPVSPDLTTKCMDAMAWSTRAVAAAAPAAC